MSHPNQPLIPENAPPSLANFRQLWPPADEKNQDLLPMLYRSSRPDLLTKEEANMLADLGMKSIIDGRASSEYSRYEGDKFIDKFYQVCKVNFPTLRWTYKPGEAVSHSPVTPKTSENIGRHFFINFFRLNYIFSIFSRGAWYIQLVSLIYLLGDLMKSTGYYKNFVSLFAKHVLNPLGLVGQYKDIVTHSQASIAAALKLLTNPSNLPAMINCSHGKDRTGIISALILSVMGKTKEYIIWDYAVTQEGLKDVMPRVRSEINERYGLGDDFAYAKAEIMEELLEFIDEKYGSVPQYLNNIGFGDDEQKQLRNNLLGIK
ncbi:uncharacterized protein LOC141899917 [Tubulanus polymorphus]|uniref:uncharacterized protein LOC141899917 n=1 Tax=Tubulanus polymorphus TaxID=672921 RepID=UPI003DA2579F